MASGAREHQKARFQLNGKIIELDGDELAATVDGRDVSLPKTPFQVLWLIAEEFPNRVSNDAVKRLLTDLKLQREQQNIDMHFYAIKRRLGAIIDRKRGLGSKLKAPVTWIDARNQTQDRAWLLDCTGPNGADPQAVKNAQTRSWKEYGLKAKREYDLGNGVKLVMVLVPHTRFFRGSLAEEVGHQKEEEPARRIELSPYYIGKFPVTCAQFAQFDDGTMARKPGPARVWNGKRWEGIESVTRPPLFFKQRSDEPVVCVSWRDAMGFIVWLQDQFDYGFDLPTEAQWECACRAGTRTPFYFGKDLTPKQANVCYIKPKTTRVGSYKRYPNAFGAYGMHGNVWEWCKDFLNPMFYEWSDEVNPVCSKGYCKVFRGGGWFDGFVGELYGRTYGEEQGIYRCRSAMRCGDVEDFRGNDLGFRVALNPHEAKPVRMTVIRA